MPAPVPSSPPARSGRRAPRKAAAKTPAEAAPHVLVAVDKALVRQGLVHLVEATVRAGGIHASASARETRDSLRRRPFDLLLIDPAQVAELGEGELRAHPCKTLLVTARDHVGEQPLAGRQLACGMLSESGDEAGMRQLLSTVAGCPLAAFERGRCCGCLAQRTWQKARLPLSPRAMQVFLRIGAGAGPGRIAAELGLSIKTVESHREKIKHKLGLGSAAALQCAALRWRHGYRLDRGDD